MNKALFVLLILLLFSAGISAQDSTDKMKDLEQRRKSLLESIELTGDKLSENQQSGLALLNALNAITAQINARKKFIQTIDNDIKSLDKQEAKMLLDIKRLEAELADKQDDYAKALRNMYSKSSHYEKLIFLFSSENLSQAYRRMRYLKEYSAWRRMQGEDVIAKSKEIESKRTQLKRNRDEKVVILNERKAEAAKLTQEEEKQRLIVQRVKKEETVLKSLLTKQKQQALNLDREIEKIIADEARKRREEMNRAIAEQARSAVKKEEKKQTKRLDDTDKKETSAVKEEIVTAKAEVKGGFAMTQNEYKLSGDFSKNKGKLPVPLSSSSYRLITRFGQQKHEQLKYVTTQSSGIELQANAGCEARAVFDGVVSRVFTIPGANNSVIIRHGNYLTVYSNLTDVYVKAGDRVSTRQALGKLFVDGTMGNRTVLKFQIWKETDKLNPELWINL